MPPRAKRVRIGTVGVDAGMLYLGDPCYVIDRPLGRMTWDQFIERLYADGGEDAPFWTVHTQPAEGSPHTFPCGIVTTTGEGDGEYPVYADLVDGRVARIEVVFIGEGDR